MASRPALEHYSTGDTPIGTLLDDPAARAVLMKYVPMLVGNTRSAAIRSQTLRSIQGYALAILSDEVLARIDADLAQLPPVARNGPPPRMTTDEARVRPYTLPDPLRASDGSRVTTARAWLTKRRPEIVRQFETLEYGRAPGRPAGEHFEVVDRGTPAFGGKAVRKQVTIALARDPAAPAIHLVEYLPAGATKRSPMFLMIGFSAPSAMIDDPGIRPSLVWDPETRTKVPAKGSPGGKFDPLPFLQAGIGVATYYYGDVEPDFAGGEALGIRGYFARTGALKPSSDTWGAIAAWAWSLSRVQDYLDADLAVDANMVAIYGASRLGKTVLWAGAKDTRFAAVIACCSGKMGAGLMRRNFGAPIAGSESEGGSNYWVAQNFTQFFGHEDALPMDGHELLALIAPRPFLLQTGKYDHAADPKGEFLAVQAAGPVYRLFGKRGIGDAQWPPSSPILGDLGYTMNSGGHGPAPGDWLVYREFLKLHGF
ncbi:MAG: hypothetical protein JF593_09475 [Novosphingobium sp.]|nr:hypothetical protein [Novosphingobium sp.]